MEPTPTRIAPDGVVDHQPTEHQRAHDPSADDLRAGDRLADDLAAVTDVVGYLRATVDPVVSDDLSDPAAWFACDRLCTDPDLLRALIASTKEGRGTDDDGVAASLFTQAYAFRTGGVPIASWLLRRRIPDPAAAHQAIAIARSRPASLGLLSPPVADLASVGGDERALLAWLVERLVEDHLRPFLGAIRAVSTVGERLLWGNAVTSMMVAVRAVEGAVPADRRLSVRTDGEALLAALPAGTRGLGSFITLSPPREDPLDPAAGESTTDAAADASEAPDGWFWERTNCCLWYRTSAATRCDDCSLTPVAERRTAFAASLRPANGAA